MADVFTFLTETLFKISPQVLNEYTRLPILEQVFYLVFFPTLFLIVFVYILTSRWMAEHKGLRILIAAAVYAFIIFQGLYEWFVVLSKYWLFGLIGLGAFWFIFRPKGSGGGGAKVSQGMTRGKGGGVLGLAYGLAGNLVPTGAQENEIRSITGSINSVYNQVKLGKEVQNLIGQVTEQINLLSKQRTFSGRDKIVKQLRHDLEQAGKGHKPTCYPKK